MEIKLVYRVLRGVSDWALSSFFSEVVVEGNENVRKDGPIILAPSHHNEILDIAALSATVPHRRIIAYWAKASLFSTPIVGGIMSSSGSIPVRRGGISGNVPENSFSKGKGKASRELTRSALYEGTVNVLTGGSIRSHSYSKRGRKRKPGVVGIFPEGTSHTEPGIIQIKEGVAWAAAEAWKTCHSDVTSDDEVGGTHEDVPLLQGIDEDLIIVPVGIIYTNKSMYRSRVYVRYGQPIFTAPYFSSISRFVSSSSSGLVATESGASIGPDQSTLSNSDSESADVENSRAAVKRLTADVEKALRKLTINASDWETLFSSRMLRDILFGDGELISLSEFSNISQRLVLLMENQSLSETLKHHLLYYHALLHYTTLTHVSLTSILRENAPSELSTKTILLTLFKLPFRLFNPSHFLFLLVLPLHLPSYVLAAFAKSYLGDPTEEESRAQIMVFAGGFGLGLGYGVGGFGMWKALGRILTEDIGNGVRRFFGKMVGYVGLDTVKVDNTLVRVGEWSSKWVRDWWVGRTIGVVGALWALSKLHAALIDRNLKLYNHIHALRIFATSLLTKPLTLSEIQPYLRTPRPAINPYIKRTSRSALEVEAGPDDVMDRFPPPPAVSPHKLVPHLISARLAAMEAVTKTFGQIGETSATGDDGGVSAELKTYLRECGARI